MKRKLFCHVVFSFLFLQSYSQGINILIDTASSRQQYAKQLLLQALKNHYAFVHTNRQVTIKFQLDQSLGDESFNIKRKENIIIVNAGDERGMIYAASSIADHLQSGNSISRIKDSNEKPFLPLRAIKFDLPWDTYRHSYALSLHDTTCRDTAYWKAFLDMMVENRLNALSLWNLHTYVYLIKPKNFPEASPWTDKEMKEWQTLFHAIFRMAHERAIDTYIIPFNIFVTPEFAKAHNVAMDNLDHNFFVRGDTAEIIKRYTRECVTQMLQEYPELTGMGLTLGEGMAGMTPQQREDWMRQTIIEGMKMSGRKVKLIHRIPFSSTTGSLGITSIETEQLTRKAIEEEGKMDFIDGPVWADLKFNWSHAHSTPKLIKVHGGKLYDTYFKPTPTSYKITWTARNEDFFCLRWGSPSFVREHVLLNKKAYSGGYFIGSETYIPAKDYFTKDTVALPWKYAFERQWLFYACWGRTMYNPSTSDEYFFNKFKYKYGVGNKNLLNAIQVAGRIPLLFASSIDCGWDFTLYSEGFMALDRDKKRVEYISIDRLINQPPLDTSYLSIAEFVKRTNAGTAFRKVAFTPIMLAEALEKNATNAIKLVDTINTENNKGLMYEVADVKIWGWLGKHWSAKIKAAIALQRYRVNGKESDKKNAMKEMEKALSHWREVVSITSKLYKDMPLVHYSEQDGKPWRENDHLRFHWRLLTPSIEKDLETIRQATFQKQ